MPVTQVVDTILVHGRPGSLGTQLRTLYWNKRESCWLRTRVADLLAVRKSAEQVTLFWLCRVYLWRENLFGLGG